MSLNQSLITRPNRHTVRVVRAVLSSVAIMGTPLLAGGALAAPAHGATYSPLPDLPAPRSATDVYVYADRVRLRELPSTDTAILAAVSRIHLSDWCQTDRGTAAAPDPAGGTSRWWSKVTLPTGSDEAWVSNVYLRGVQGSGRIPGVPLCRN